MTDHDVIDKAVSDYLDAAELLSGKPRPEGIRWAILAALAADGRMIVHQGAIARAERRGMERAIDCIRNSHRLSVPICEHLVVEIRAELEDVK